MHDWRDYKGNDNRRYCYQCGMDQLYTVEEGWFIVVPHMGPRVIIRGCEGETPYLVPLQRD